MPRPSRFALALVLVAIGALAVRVVYILVVFPSDRMSGDAVEFHWLARLLADGYGYVQPAPLLDAVTGPDGTRALGLDPNGERISTADKPPLYPFVLALASLIDPESTTLQRLISAVIGTGSVVVAGLIGRRIASPAIGLLAAALLAVYPPMWLADGSLRSETLYALLIAGALLAALRLLDRPTWGRAAWLGALVGLASLARGEALVLIVPALALIVWRTRPAPWRALLAGALAFALLVTPWLVRNWTVFDQPTAITSNDGGLVYGANCDRAYYGTFTGAWACFPRYGPDERNEAEASDRLRDIGLEYIGDNAGRAPVVVGARVLRVWDLWAFPAGAAQFEAEISGREPSLQRAASWSFYLLVPFAAAGIWLLRRRPLELAILLTPFVLVTFIAVIGYGTVRFRAPAEVPLVVLASLALGRAVVALRARRGSRERQAAGV